ncbi:MAG: NAD-binding protein [Thermoleophilaceae bacterium]|nr:NAD-binding protein [Thermoleophilaceae bacterium]
MSNRSHDDASSDEGESRTGARPSVGRSASRRVLLIGGGRLADATERALEAGGASVVRLEDPSDPDIRAALEEDVDGAVIVSRSDVVSLRLALVVAHVRPGLPLLVTTFGRDVAAQLESTVENVRVLSMADLVVPAFAGPCLDSELLSLAGPVSDIAAVEAPASEDRPRRTRLHPPGPSRTRRVLGRLESIARPFDASARILQIGSVGFISVLLVETAVTALARGVPLVDAFYTSMKVTVTVGPSSAAEGGPDWFKLFSAAAMLLIVGFTAVLTAGLVNYLLDPRLTGIVGRSAVPRRNHVVVVGLGEVGLRLCQLFRELGVPVVAVERNDEAPTLARAKDQRIPVVIGGGESHDLLRRLSLSRARSLAAVTSDEVENLAIAVAARGFGSDLPIALRAGDGDATTEIRSLFDIGVVRDVYRIAGTALAAVALGYDAREAFPYQGTLYLVDHHGEIEPFVPVGSPAAR